MTIWSKEKRRKFILWLGRVPSSLERICLDVLGVTDAVLAIIDSKGVEALVDWTPTKVDDVLLKCTKKALELFRQNLLRAADRKQQKRILGDMAKYMVAYMDNNKSGYDVYHTCFETVFEGQKKYIGDWTKSV